MFRARPLAALALAALFAPAAPALADDATEFTGFSCGFSSTNDPTGAIQQNPDVQFGEMNCGPWFAADWNNENPPDPNGIPTIDPNVPPSGAVSIRECGWIQVNNPVISGPVSPSALFCVDGTTVVAGAGQISYTATTTDNIYQCTRVTMTHDGIEETFDFDDDDDPTNGTQCSLAISAGA